MMSSKFSKSERKDDDDMQTFHARIDSVTRDLTRYEASESKFAGPTMQYTAEWIARLQCRNDILDKKSEVVDAMLVEARESVKEEVDRLKKVILDMAKELGIQDVALAASKRKLDAANELLQDKDGIIADLRERQEEILGEDAEYFEELEACNKRQKEMLERQTKLMEEDKLAMLRLADQKAAQQCGPVVHLDGVRTLREIKDIVSRALGTY